MFNKKIFLPLVILVLLPMLLFSGGPGRVYDFWGGDKAMHLYLLKEDSSLVKLPESTTEMIVGKGFESIVSPNGQYLVYKVESYDSESGGAQQMIGLIE